MTEVPDLRALRIKDTTKLEVIEAALKALGLWTEPMYASLQPSHEQMRMHASAAAHLQMTDNAYILFVVTTCIRFVSDTSSVKRWKKERSELRQQFTDTRFTSV